MVVLAKCLMIKLWALHVDSFVSYLTMVEKNSNCNLGLSLDPNCSSNFLISKNC